MVAVPAFLAFTTPLEVTVAVIPLASAGVAVGITVSFGVFVGTGVRAR